MKHSAHFWKRAAAPTAALACALFAGCMNGADKEDDPEYEKYKDAEVNQETARASFAAEAAVMQDWDASMDLPISNVDFPGTADSGWMAMPKVSSLRKAAADEVTIDSSTRAAGYITISVRRPGFLHTTYDTAVVKWDALAQDNIEDNENILRWSHTVAWVGGNTDRVALTDADGDGFVNVVAGRDNRVRAEFTQRSTRLDSKQQVESAVVVTGPGADNDFDTEGDNRFYQAAWSRTVNGVLTASAVFADEDGDGKVLDNAAVSVVRLSAWESEPPFRPRVKSVGAVIRIRKLGFGLGDELVGFRYADTLKSGRTHTVYIRNSDGGEDVRANDTLRVFLETRQKDRSDSLRSLDVQLALNLGSSLKSDHDDAFYSLKAEAHNRLGFHRDVRFEIVSSAPVPKGQEPQNGTFLFEVTYANLKRISLEGTFTPTAFHGVYTGPTGDTARVHIAR
jgi:hypothetical protein